MSLVRTKAETPPPLYPLHRAAAKQELAASGMHFTAACCFLQDEEGGDSDPAVYEGTPCMQTAPMMQQQGARWLLEANLVVAAAAEQQLGRGVDEGAHGQAARVHVGRGHVARQAHVCNLGRPVARQQDVLALHVRVHHLRRGTMPQYPPQYSSLGQPAAHVHKSQSCFLTTVAPTGFCWSFSCGMFIDMALHADRNPWWHGEQHVRCEDSARQAACAGGPRLVLVQEVEAARNVERHGAPAPVPLQPLARGAAQRRPQVSALPCTAQELSRLALCFSRDPKVPF